MITWESFRNRGPEETESRQRVNPAVYIYILYDTGHVCLLGKAVGAKVQKGIVAKVDVGHMLQPVQDAVSVGRLVPVLKVLVWEAGKLRA